MALRVDVNGERLWRSINEINEIGATPAGGVRRLALTDDDRLARDVFVDWCRGAGCEVSVDRIGNLFARREGRDPSRAPVLLGSHLDTQPTGGRFDGIYGVLAGLEVLRTLDDHDVVTEAPIEVAVWTNEEGARFAPAMLGSGVFAGVFSLEEGLGATDPDGITLGDELVRTGFAGEVPLGGRALDAYLELHIEQGPVLEADGLTIGVVEGVLGIRWYDITLDGQEAHAGPTPMGPRRDALLGAARLVEVAHAVALAHTPEGRATVGVIEARPGSRNTVPGHVSLSVDLRHPDPEVLATMDGELHDRATEAAEALGLVLAIEPIWYSPPVAFDPALVDAIEAAAAGLGLPSRRMVSGAGHDACYLAQVAPTAMIFIPCAGGLSHNEAETIESAHATAGAQVLLRAALARAGA